MVYIDFFTVVSLLAVVSATPHKRTVAQIEADLSDIASQVSALNTDINVSVKGLAYQVLTPHPPELSQFRWRIDRRSCK